MHIRIGPLLIALSFIFTCIVWSFVEPIKNVSIYRQYSQLLASIIIVALAWINFISTRHRLIDTLFNGLDKSYLYHKYLSILSLALIWVHKLTVGLGKIRSAKPVKPVTAGLLADVNWKGLGEDAAQISMLLFTGLVLFAIVAVKLDYQKWKLLHKLTLIPFILGIFHYYANSDYLVLAANPYSLWMNLIILIGISSASYSVFLYERLSFKYQYKVDQIRAVAKDTIEVSATASGAEMQYKPGQYAFLKILGKENAFPSHPFTITQAPTPGQIQFAIKALGDHTAAIQKSLNKGAVIALAGPHGKFDYQLGAKRQIWLAGGIGITPFRAFCQSRIPADYSIDLVYAYANKQEAPYVKELQQLEVRENLRIHLIDSSETGFLTMEDIEKFVDKTVPFDVYFCGPKGMREKFKHEFTMSRYPINAFHYEQFQFI